jgi:hypothetical protein
MVHGPYIEAILVIAMQAAHEEQLINSVRAQEEYGLINPKDDTTLIWKEKYLAVFNRMLQLNFKVLLRLAFRTVDMLYDVMVDVSFLLTSHTMDNIQLPRCALGGNCSLSIVCSTSRV